MALQVSCCRIQDPEDTNERNSETNISIAIPTSSRRRSEENTGKHASKMPITQTGLSPVDHGLAADHIKSLMFHFNLSEETAPLLLVILRSNKYDVRDVTKLITEAKREVDKMEIANGINDSTAHLSHSNQASDLLSSSNHFRESIMPDNLVLNSMPVERIEDYLSLLMCSLRLSEDVESTLSFVLKNSNYETRHAVAKILEAQKQTHELEAETIHPCLYQWFYVRSPHTINQCHDGIPFSARYSSSCILPQSPIRMATELGLRFSPY